MCVCVSVYGMCICIYVCMYSCLYMVSIFCYFLRCIYCRRLAYCYFSICLLFVKLTKFIVK